jgi:hypothetical protein
VNLKVHTPISVPSVGKTFIPTLRQDGATTPSSTCDNPAVGERTRCATNIQLKKNWLQSKGCGYEESVCGVVLFEGIRLVVEVVETMHPGDIYSHHLID